MKYIFLCLTFLCLTFLCLFTGCTSHQTNSKKSYVEINYDSYQEKMNRHDTFALYIGSETCSACQRFQPTLEKVIADYNLEIFYLDTSKLTMEQNDQIWDASSIAGTPTIVFVEAGNIKLFPRVDGAVAEVTLVNKLKTAGYIKG